MLYFSFGARQCMQMQHLNSYRQRLFLGQKSCIIGFICNFYNIFLHTATVAMNCTLSRKNSIIHEHFYSKTNRICLFLDEAVRHGSGPLLTPQSVAAQFRLSFTHFYVFILLVILLFVIVHIFVQLFF